MVIVEKLFSRDSFYQQTQNEHFLYPVYIQCITSLPRKMQGTGRRVNENNTTMSQKNHNKVRDTSNKVKQKSYYPKM